MDNKDKMIKDLNYIIDGLFDELSECKRGENVGVCNYEYWKEEYKQLAKRG